MVEIDLLTILPVVVPSQDQVNLPVRKQMGNSLQADLYLTQRDAFAHLSTLKKGRWRWFLMCSPNLPWKQFMNLRMET